MYKKRLHNILLVGLLLFAVFGCMSILASPASAQAQATVYQYQQGEANFFVAVFEPFGSSMHRVYARFGPFIDALIYLIIFLGLSQATFGRLFQNRRGGKALQVGVGIMLAFSLALWERQAGFNIMSFGPMAAIILIALMGYAVWAGIKSLEIEGVDTLTTTAIVYLLVYYSLSAIVPNVIDWINRNIPIIGALLALLAAVFTIFLLVKIIMWIMNMFSGTGPLFGTGTPAPGAPGMPGGPGGPGTPGGPGAPGTPGGGGGPPGGGPPGGGPPGRGGPPGGGGGGRPPGQVPPPTPKSIKTDDPPSPPGGPPPGEPKIKGPSVPKLPKKPKIPDEQEMYVDLSPDFGRIRDQDSLGACSAFAASSIFEYIRNILNGRKEELAPGYLYYKAREEMGTQNRDSGLIPAITCKTLRDTGVCFEHLWKFEGSATNKWRTPPDTAANADAVQKKIIDFRSLDKNDPDQWASELFYERNPCYISVEVPSDWHGGYRKKFYDNFNPSLGGLHGMALVGYHSHYPYKGTGIKAFKIRNSWGDWGENGYTWVPAETLKKIMYRNPIVLVGWKKDKIGRIKVTGRAVFDEPGKKLKIEQSGAQIYSGKHETPDHPFAVGLMGQIEGRIFPLVETIVKPSAKGKFKLELDCDFTMFQRLTQLPEQFPKHFAGVNFEKLPAGLVVYKRSLDARDREIYFHIVKFHYSLGGRGGEGIENHPDNPCSAALHPGHEISGRPIVFSQTHLEENNVIIPVVWYPWMGEQPILEEKEQEALKKVKEYSKKEQDWVAAEYGYLKKVIPAVEKGYWDRAKKALINVGRAERRVHPISERLDKELAELIPLLPEKFKAKCEEIKEKLKVEAKTILTDTSRVLGDLRGQLDALIEVAKKLNTAHKEYLAFKKRKEALDKKKDTLKGKEITELNELNKEKIPKKQEEIDRIEYLKSTILPKLVQNVEQVIMWENGLQTLLKRLEHVEAEIEASTEKKLK